MALSSQIKYETKIENLEDISPESVLSMLHEVGADIRRLDTSFADLDLKKVLAVVEAGEYVLSGTISTRIDLSAAKRIIDTYHHNSEGGCQSCQKLGSQMIDAMDHDIGWYCQIADPDYSRTDGVKYDGNTPKVEKYYHTPCNDWKPTFSPTLEKLIESQK